MALFGGRFFSRALLGRRLRGLGPVRLFLALARTVDTVLLDTLLRRNLLGGLFLDVLFLGVALPDLLSSLHGTPLLLELGSGFARAECTRGDVPLGDISLTSA